MDAADDSDSLCDYSYAGRWNAIDWTWQRAHQRVESDVSHDPTFDDEWVERTRRFLVERQSVTAGGTTATSQEADLETIAEAIDIHERSDLEREILQAWLLTGESYDHIAKRLAIKANTIAAYERIFFHFRPFFRDKSWITAHAIEPAADGSSFGVLLRKVAYSGGAAAFEPVVDVVRTVAASSLVADLPNPRTPAGKQELLIRRMLAFELLPLNARSSAEMHRIQSELSAGRSG